MAEEKIVRISADASGFGQEVDRMSDSAKRAFSDIGLDGLFDIADKKFDSIEDKLKAITEELNKKKQEANDVFDRKREESGGNQYYKKNIDKEQQDYNDRHNKAMSEWEKFVEKLNKKLERENKKSSSKKEEPEQSTLLSRLFGGMGGNVGNLIGRVLPGRAGSQIGSEIGQMLGRKGADIGRSISTTAKGAEVAGAGGEVAGAGMLAGAGTATIATAGIAAVVIAVAAALKQLYGMGIEDWKTESRVNATFSIDRDTFGKGGSDFDMKNKEYKEFILQSAKSRGTAYDIENIARRELSYVKGYGLNQQEVTAFDKFNYQDSQKKDGTFIIADILTRAEKQGILGVSAGDFSRLPEKIAQVSNIMAIQKMSGEKADSLSAVNFMAAGSQIGGRFGDDRAAEVYSRMNESIKNPTNPGMKAYIFEMLKKANPNSSFTDLMGIMENGASGDNLKAILPSISKIPQGEMRRMLLYQLTKNWQDANRLDGAGNLNTMLSYASSKGTTSQEAEKKYSEAMDRTTNNIAALDEVGKIIKNSLTDFGEKYIVRPFNDLLRGNMQGNTNDLMRTMSLTNPMLLPFTPFIGKGYDSNTGRGENAVTTKTTH